LQQAPQPQKMAARLNNLAAIFITKQMLRARTAALLHYKTYVLAILFN